jgi:MFS family permease
VAEHAPAGKRGAFTSWIQTTATLGLFLSLMVILGTRTAIGEEAFADWGWRIPFLVSILLLAVSVYIRLSMNESPAFVKMKAEGKTSKAPLTESFGEWKNLKIVILALVGLTAGQAVVWYSGQFYALFFLTQALKVDGATANIMVAISLIIGTPFFIVFGTLSDKIGRKPIILAGCFLAAVTYFPVFQALTKAANPDLYAAQANAKVVVTADPGECSFQFNPTGTKKFTSSCDIAKQRLAGASVSYINEVAAPGTPATIKVGETLVVVKNSAEDIAAAKAKAEEKLAALNAAEPKDAKAIEAATKSVKDLSGEKTANGALLGANLSAALKAAGYPAKADMAKFDKTMVIIILTYLVILVTMVYGPIAAMLVEMFPTRIRYTSMSLPYHIGNGWFGGLLPTTAFAIVAQTGDMYNGLWYPIIIAGATVVIGGLFIKETKDVDIYAKD